jgi:glucosamine-6-phosphate deaminase
MEVVILRNYAALSRLCANIITRTINKKPNTVLALPTGKTPLGAYRQLVEAHRKRRLDFSNVTIFALDEYAGLSSRHRHSFANFLQKNLIARINVPRGKFHFPSGVAEDFERECAQYEERLKRAGGIDLVFLGIGVNGHIGFNEPGSSLGSRTRIKTLTEETLNRNSRLFTSKNIPRFALTVGIGTIMEGKEILLAASGREKADAVKLAVEGPITARVPASILQMHPRVTCVLDEEAASKLANIDYYKWVRENKWRVQKER